LKWIADIQVERLRARLAERRIALDLTDGAREYLALTGYDPNYGARPLKRLIQKEIETILGRLILKGEVKDGDRVQVDQDAKLNRLTFRVQNSTQERPPAGSEDVDKVSAA
jgi:ATP-dependent Clp protease ATP-binding subunit ClpB